MSLPKISEILDLERNQLEKEILETKKQLFDLRFKKGTRQSFQPHSFSHLKHRLGQLLMIQTQKLSTTKRKN